MSRPAMVVGNQANKYFFSWGGRFPSNRLPPIGDCECHCRARKKNRETQSDDQGRSDTAGDECEPGTMVVHIVLRKPLASLRCPYPSSLVSNFVAMRVAGIIPCKCLSALNLERRVRNARRCEREESTRFEQNGGRANPAGGRSEGKRGTGCGGSTGPI